MSNQKNVAPRRGRVSSIFKKTLANQWKPLIELVAKDKDLDLQVRDNYFNIYYDGGNVLRVTPTVEGLYFDPWYFYDGTHNGREIPKTYIEEQAKGKPRDKQPKNYPTAEEADIIYKEIKNKADKLLKYLNDNDFDSYFNKAKEVVGKWVEYYNHNERKDQHYIACSNREFTDKNNLVVIDIEFAVSTLKPYNKVTKKDGKSKVPKMDVIAVDRKGQIYSIELKENDKADDKNSPHNVKQHLEDFKHSIGYNSPQNDFAEEMAEVVRIKKQLGILGSDVFVDTTLLPEFAIAFTGKDEQKKSEFKKNHSGLTFVEVESKSEKEKYLKLT